MGSIRTSSFGLLAVLTGAVVATAPGCGSRMRGADRKRSPSTARRLDRDRAAPGAARHLADGRGPRALRAARCGGRQPLETPCRRAATPTRAATMNPPSGNAYPPLPASARATRATATSPEIMALGLCYQTAAGVDDALGDAMGSGGGAPARPRWRPPRAAEASRRAPTTATASATTASAWRSATTGSVPRSTPRRRRGSRPRSTRGSPGTTLRASSATSPWATTSPATSSRRARRRSRSRATTRTRHVVERHRDAHVADPRRAGLRDWLAGGGWPEGWQYGPLSVRNLAGFSGRRNGQGQTGGTTCRSRTRRPRTSASSPGRHASTWTIAGRCMRRRPSRRPRPPSR